MQDDIVRGSLDGQTRVRDIGRQRCRCFQLLSNAMTGGCLMTVLQLLTLYRPAQQEHTAQCSKQAAHHRCLASWKRVALVCRRPPSPPSEDLKPRAVAGFLENATSAVSWSPRRPAPRLFPPLWLPPLLLIQTTGDGLSRDRGLVVDELNGRLDCLCATPAATRTWARSSPSLSLSRPSRALPCKSCSDSRVRRSVTPFQPFQNRAIGFLKPVTS